MLIAYEVSRELIGCLRPLVPIIANEDRDLADQLRRAASSVVLNIAEGQRSAKGNRQRHYAIAHGSANEVKAALHTALGWGWIDEADGSLQVLDHLLRLLWGLTRSGR